MPFETGSTLITRGVNEKIMRNSLFAKFIVESFSKYLRDDWGDIPESDKAMNDLATKNNDDRIVARYNNMYGDIYIITEWDRSATTILFVEEY